MTLMLPSYWIKFHPVSKVTFELSFASQKVTLNPFEAGKIHSGADKDSEDDEDPTAL